MMRPPRVVMWLSLLLLWAGSRDAGAQDSLRISLTRDTILVQGDTVIVTTSDTSHTTDSIPLRERIDTAISTLDTSLFPANIMLEKALPWYDMRQFDGALTNDSTLCTRFLFREFAGELPSGRVRYEGEMTALDSLDSTTGRLVASGVVPIGIMNVRCFNVKLNALADTLLMVSPSGTHLLDLPGAPASPYETRHIMMAAALAPFSLSDTVRFTVDTSRLYVTNLGDTIRAILIDFGDGNGFRAVGNDSVVNVWYGDGGRKTITVRLVYGASSTDTLQAMTYLDVIGESDSSRAGLGKGSGSEALSGSQNFGEQPDDSIAITSSVPYLGSYGHGTGYIWYGCNNTEITKPVIFVEGIDPIPFDLVGSLSFYRKYNGGDPFQFNGWTPIMRELRSKGFDIIMLNFTHGADYIQRNAYVLEQLIEEVNARKVGNVELIVLGESMGGVIARYALADMEQRDIEHHTRLFISHDAPQRGAYLPVSLQQCARWTEAKFSGLINVAKVIATDLASLPLIPSAFPAISRDADALEQLTSGMLPSQVTANNPAIRQLTVMYVDDDDDNGGHFFPTIEHPDRTALQNELAALGYPNPTNAPSGLRKTAITDGDIYGHRQNDNAGPWLGEERLLRLKAGGWTTPLMDAGFTLWTMPDPALGDRVVARFYRSFLFFASTTEIVFRSKRCYECMPGGAHNALRLIRENGHDKFPGYMDCPFDNFCFIPTVSALDVDVDDWEANLDWELRNGSLHTPFNAYYGYAGNKFHTLLDGPTAANILKQEIFLDDTYLQNLLVPNSRDYRAYRNIVAGNDVYPLSFDFRPSRPAAGSVVIEDGAQVEMVAGTGIDLEPGFEVEPGADLYAHIEPPQPCAQPLPKQPLPPSAPSTRPSPEDYQREPSALAVAPNPFATATVIEYAVTTPAPVSLVIGDPLGRTIRVLVDVERAQPGDYRVPFDADGLPSGWYSCILRIGDRVELRKILLEK